MKNKYKVKIVFLIFLLSFIFNISFFSFAQNKIPSSLDSKIFKNNSTSKKKIKDNTKKNTNPDTNSFFSDIKIGDYIVFKVGAINSLTHEERAEIINNRINNILKTQKKIPKATIVSYGNKNLIKIGDTVILTVTNQDAYDNLKTLNEISKEWAEKLDNTILLFKKNIKKPIIIDGVILFKLGPTEYLTPSERAEIVNRRLRSFVINPEKIKPVNLSKEYGEWTIRIDKRVLITIVKDDTKFESITSSQELAKKWAQIIDKALERAKLERSPNYIIIAIIKIILCLLFLFILYKVLKFIRDKLINIVNKNKISTKNKRYFNLLIKFVHFLFILTLIGFMTFFIMDLTPYTRPYLLNLLQNVPDILDKIRIFLYNNIIIIFIIIITIIVLRIINFYITKIFNFIKEEVSEVSTEKTNRFILRSNTLRLIINSLLKVLIIFVSFILITNQLNIDIMPILASAGILGLAISFGAQNLVKDIINGFFIVFEDQYSVGDVVNINNIIGTVEKMNLRITQLRGQDGSLTSIPNSNITIVTNLSKEWANAILDIGVNLNEDIEKVMDIIIKTSNKLKEDLNEKVISPPVMLGVEKIEDSKMIIRIMIKTLPFEQWNVTRELRKRIKLAFDQEGISVPFPQQVVWFANQQICPLYEKINRTSI